MTGHEFITNVCASLVYNLTSNGSIKKWTTNSELIGAYAEATVSEFVCRFVSPLRVSRGSIAYEGNCPALPELDAIVWHPAPLPPILEAGTFAIVPRSSALAFLEIKRSNYSGVGARMKEHLSQENTLIPVMEGEKAWKPAPPKRAIGVICLYDSDRSDTALQELIQQGRAVTLLRRESATEQYVPHTESIVALSQFLMGIRLRARFVDGVFIAKMPVPMQDSTPPRGTHEDQVPSSAGDGSDIPPSGTSPYLLRQ